MTRRSIQRLISRSRRRISNALHSAVDVAIVLNEAFPLVAFAIFALFLFCASRTVVP
jgi:hypothetical protein